MGLTKRLFTTGFILLVMSLVSLAGSTLFAADSLAENNAAESIRIKNPASDLWRAVRNREFDGATNFSGSSQIKNPNSGLLINAEGNEWRKLRRQKLLPYGAYFLIGVVGLLILLIVFIRRRKIPEGRSGNVIPRMSSMQRISHWLMASLIGFMAMTGLLLLFGRFVVIPLIGVEAFSPLASASKEGHNLFGPLVIVSLVLFLIYFIRHNWPAKGDLKWLLTAGGLFSKKHLKIGFFNTGEKLLFWGTIVLGLVLSATGLLLLFPSYQETVNFTQLALVIHAIAALLLIALAFGHIWMVRTVEGTLDAITTGDVDENWAKAHHSEWAEKMVGKSVVKEDVVANSSISNNAIPDSDHEGAY